MLAHAVKALYSGQHCNRPCFSLVLLFLGGADGAYELTKVPERRNEELLAEFERRKKVNTRSYSTVERCPLCRGQINEMVPQFENILMIVFVSCTNRSMLLLSRLMMQRSKFGLES